jgi:UDP-N-acetylglucosamine--N-acetylmuramyl-(pentapeptide) pyrophosphoryl-undecaprenol N-acetylglucosamine transferase
MPNRPLTLCLTGGGTAGHVTPHFALLPGIQARGWRAFYVGSSGLEKPLVEAQGIEFHAIATGKLRRYLSVQNLLDVFKVGVGAVQAFFLLLRKRPDAVFSKGGFVAVPVALAAWALRIPVVSHESDLTPGLATRIIARFAKLIVYTFPETARYLKPDAQRVGTPIRQELFEGDRARGLALCGFDPREDLPTLLVMGGSQGAVRVNEALEKLLPTLLGSMRVIHLTGKGKALAFAHPRYKGFEFVSAELKDLFAASDLFMGRAGSNSIFEVLALRKPMLLVPLEIGSRGDQVLNADAFAKNGWAHVLRETELTPESLGAKLAELQRDAEAMRARQAAGAGGDAATRILDVLAGVAS